MCGVVRKARGCSVLGRSKMGSATLCRDGCFVGRPCALHAGQGTTAEEALGCSVEGCWRGGNEGRVPDWARDLGAVLPALGGAPRGSWGAWGGRGGAPFGTGFLVLLSSAMGWGG